MAPDLDDPAARAVAAGHRAAAGRRPVARRRTASPSRRGRSCSASSTGSPSAAGRAYVGTELEFILFDDTYEQACDKQLHRPDVRPTSTTSTTRSSARAGSSRCCARSGSACATPGMQVESAKGECNLGQHEIAFKYADALTTCDNHVIYKTGAKEIAAQQG